MAWIPLHGTLLQRFGVSFSGLPLLLIVLCTGWSHARPAEARVTPGARALEPLQGLSAPVPPAHFVLPVARYAMEHAVASAAGRAAAVVRSPLAGEIGESAHAALVRLHGDLDRGICNDQTLRSWEAVRSLPVDNDRWNAALLWSRGWIARCRGDWPTVTRTWTQAVTLDAAWCDVVAVGFGEPDRLIDACPHLAGGPTARRWSPGAIAEARLRVVRSDTAPPQDPAACSTASLVDSLQSGDASRRLAAWQPCVVTCEEEEHTDCREHWTQTLFAGRALLSSPHAGARERLHVLLRTTTDPNLDATLRRVLLRDARRRDADAEAWEHLHALRMHDPREPESLEACLSLGLLLGHTEEAENCWWSWYRHGAAWSPPLDALVRTLVATHLEGRNDEAATMLVALRSRLESSLHGADQARLLYWSGRVAWEQGRRHQATTQFRAAWYRAPLSYFGQSARRWHETHLGPLPELKGWTQLPAHTAYDSLSSPALLGVLRLHESGFSRYARTLLRDIVGHDTTEDQEAALLLALWTAETGDHRSASWWARGPGRVEDLSWSELQRWGEPILGAAYPLLREGAWHAAALHEGIHPAWMPATIRRESGFRDGLISSVGARGLMQILPETAAWLDRLHPSTPLAWGLENPTINSRIGARLLRHLAERYDESPEWVAAAYSTGSGRVDRWRAQWPQAEGAHVVEMIPYPSVRAYLLDVVSAFGVYAHRLEDRGTHPAETTLQIGMPLSLTLASRP